MPFFRLYSFHLYTHFSSLPTYIHEIIKFHLSSYLFIYIALFRVLVCLSFHFLIYSPFSYYYFPFLALPRRKWRKYTFALLYAFNIPFDFFFFFDFLNIRCWLFIARSCKVMIHKKSRHRCRSTHTHTHKPKPDGMRSMCKETKQWKQRKQFFCFAWLENTLTISKRWRWKMRTGKRQINKYYTFCDIY